MAGEQPRRGYRDTTATDGRFALVRNGPVKIGQPRRALVTTLASLTHARANKGCGLRTEVGMTRPSSRPFINGVANSSGGAP